MWKDGNDKIFNIQNSIDNFVEFPTICPICGKKEGHLFFYRHEEKGVRGGGWAWCSACRNFGHASVQVPEWWINLNTVGLEMLTAIPIALEENKDTIDKWVNQLLSIHQNV